MAYPTLGCSLVSETFSIDPAAHPPKEYFNQVFVYYLDEANTLVATWTCDPVLSNFIPANNSDNSLTQAEFQALWLPILSLFVTGFIVKMLLRQFK